MGGFSFYDFLSALRSVMHDELIRATSFLVRQKSSVCSLFSYPPYPLPQISVVFHPMIKVIILIESLIFGALALHEVLRNSQFRIAGM